MQTLAMGEIDETIATLQPMRDDQTGYLATLARLGDHCVAALQAGGKIMWAGNGGSAADSQHLAAELVSRFNFDRPGLASVALTVDTSALTAIGNDYGFDRLFARQVEAIGASGDVMIGISTSGNSANVVNGLIAARAKGIFTAGFCGAAGGAMLEHCDLVIRIPSLRTPKIQEGHVVTGHILCAYIEESLFPDKKPDASAP